MIDRFIVSAGKKAFKKVEGLKDAMVQVIRQQRLRAYLNSDRRPWRSGYAEYRAQYLSKVINDNVLLETFRNSKPLPEGYGFRLDARVVEIPWFLSRVASKTGKLLDAGSSLNYDFLLKVPDLANKTITIITLVPEVCCYWNLGISYVFGDIRRLDFRENLFNMIACISTIEHVGMDNSMYTGQADSAQGNNKKDFLLAVKELERVLKPDGVLYITFPFGQYEDHGWFQQFDSRLVDLLIEAFDPSRFKETVFRYIPDGWKLSDRASCAQCQCFDVHKSKYFDPKSTIEYPPDYPAGERAVVCLELFK